MSNKYPKYHKNYQTENLGYYDRFIALIKNIQRVLKIASKPGRTDYFTVFKIVVIGLAVLGALSYVVQLIFSFALPVGGQ